VYNGLAIDHIHQKLYFADDGRQKSYNPGTTDAGGELGELSTDGTSHRVLISDVNFRPQALVLDNDNR